MTTKHTRQKRWTIYYRTFFGLLGLSAVFTEITVLIGRGQFNPANFFSYFTIESNILAASVLLIAAHTSSSTRGIALLRGAMTLYMVMTGVVFALLLSGLKDVSFTAVPWDNVVLHYIMPVAVLIDWLLDTPRFRLTWRRALAWLVFPLVYVAYSLARGPWVNWYPYPFLNPETQGYVGVVTTSVGIVIFAMIVVWLLTARTRKGEI